MTKPRDETHFRFFDEAKAAPGRAIKVTREHAEYMLGVLPPVYGTRCFAMGEVADHAADGTEMYYWTTKRAGQHYSVLGTRQEAERAFAAQDVQ